MFRINARGRHPARPATPTTSAPPAAEPQPAAPLAQEPLPAYLRPAAALPAGAVLTVAPDQVRALLLAGRVPAALVVTGPVRLRGETRLRELPTSLECTQLDVRDCPNLELLPDRLRAVNVRASGTAVREVSGDWLVREHLDLSNNPRLNRLPERLTTRSLDVSNCPQLRQLPAGLHLTHWLEVAGSGLSGLPAGLRVPLRWQGTSVDERTAFRPDELRAIDLLQVRNVTHRRVLIDRMGLERFVQELGGLVLDRDRDAGGERQLLSVPLTDDEPIHALKVICPSTGHNYVLRVPPHIRTCRRAAAWLAGFDNEQDYRPIIET
ncbi:hypothetical protein EJV47_23875 [Hymenobacter gummosus]|uniref:DUF6745 domain-containing protein n=1 Tax=Hymenobacter gummosus TaxID=1776032 RepID=A0A431TWU1_9BACT|nr:hypothetical protein [Hymenobacter gummosus]RTQ45872.1 hypothetical protein EJV47_23875 [Hymenobacter gummosus]